MATPGHDRDKTTIGYALPHNPPPGGYPFPVPPPATSYSAFYQQPTPQTPPPPPSMNSVLCRFLGIFAVIVAILAMILLIIRCILKPEVPAFQVDSASVTWHDSTSPYLTATWNITLFVTNPNRKLAITYDAVSADVLYGQDVPLAHTRLPPFIQQSRGETTLPIEFEVVDEFVDDGVAIRLASDRARGSVPFGLTFWASVRFRASIFHSRVYLLKADCRPLRFAFSPQNDTGALIRGFLCQ